MGTFGLYKNVHGMNDLKFCEPFGICKNVHGINDPSFGGTSGLGKNVQVWAHIGRLIESLDHDSIYFWKLKTKLETLLATSFLFLFIKSNNQLDLRVVRVCVIVVVMV